MHPKKTPGGSLFPYPYKGGELLGLHYGSFHSDEAGLLARMQGEAAFIAETHKQFPLWIDFYETKLTDRILAEFVESLRLVQAHITKLAIVGCSWWNRRRLLRQIQRSGAQLPMPVRFFSDPEVAKTWLVSE